MRGQYGAAGRGPRCEPVHTRSRPPAHALQGNRLEDPAQRDRAEVFALRWSADGKMLASVGMDDTHRHWDVTTGRQLRRLDVPAGAPSPDFRFQAGGRASAMWLWETETGRPCGVLLPLSDGRNLSVSPAGHFAPARAERDLVYVVQLKDGRQETLTPEEFRKKHGWKNEPEARAHDADDLHVEVVDRQPTADRARIAPETALPQLVADHDACDRDAVRIFAGDQRPPEQRRGAEERQQIVGDPGRGDPLHRAVDQEAGIASLRRGDARDQPALRAHVEHCA